MQNHGWGPAWGHARPWPTGPPLFHQVIPPLSWVLPHPRAYTCARSSPMLLPTSEHLSAGGIHLTSSLPFPHSAKPTPPLSLTSDLQLTQLKVGLSAHGTWPLRRPECLALPDAFWLAPACPSPVALYLRGGAATARLAFPTCTLLFQLRDSKCINYLLTSQLTSSARPPWDSRP